MRLVVQRVSEASVEVSGGITGEIGKGLLVYFGAGVGDTEASLDYAIDKTVNLRIFPDRDGKMDESLRQIGGEILVVSQFTLYADIDSGRRPDFGGALEASAAERLYESYLERLRAVDELSSVEAGKFGKKMNVSSVNDGPVTIIVDDAS